MSETTAYSGAIRRLEQREWEDIMDGMSETTLTKDVVWHLRDLAEQADSCGHGLHVTPQQMLALCDAAARAETLEAERDKARQQLRVYIDIFKPEGTFPCLGKHDGSFAVKKDDKLVCLLCERDALAAQLTEVTRELLETRAQIPTERPEGERLLLNAYGRSCYDAGRESTSAALAPLRAVVEDLRSWLFEQFDVFKSRDSITARAIAASFKDVIVKLDALSALPADPSAPTPR